MSNNDKPLQDFEGLGKILDHNYDDIRELDNPLPGWWLATFWITIVFGIGYYAYYELMGGPSLDDELNANMATITAQISANKTADDSNNSPDTIASDLKALLASADALAKGKEQFVAKCLACHGAEGQGQIGPNLTDEFWIHGNGTMVAIREVIKTGVLEKGMPAWEQLLSADDLNNVTVFVRSLQGTNPANSKAPQGEKQEIQD